LHETHDLVPPLDAPVSRGQIETAIAGKNRRYRTLSPLLKHRFSLGVSPEMPQMDVRIGHGPPFAIAGAQSGNST
jgi:hypothetical protein